MTRKVLIIDGSCAGRDGNTYAVLRVAAEKLAASKINVEWLHLQSECELPQIENAIAGADAFIFGSGTYWQSWGSPLQRFLEQITHTEGSEIWLGKPAAVIVTIHSVGGIEVVARLQSVLSLFGLTIPPMSGFVYSAVNQHLMQTADESVTEDLWRLSDLDVVVHNLLAATLSKARWKAWPVDRKNFMKKWISD